jgi:Ca2+-binding RTX toxin-like protein
MATFNATGGGDNLTGSAGNTSDTFVFTPGTAQAGDKVDGRGGVDTVQASGASGSTVDLKPIGAGFTSIEVLKIDAGVTALLDSGSTGGGTGHLPTNLTLDGGASGVSTLNFSMNGGSINLSGIQFGANWTEGTDVLRVFGTSGADTMTGTSRADDLQGGMGNDVIRGGGGNDKINGGADIDTAVISGPASSIFSTPTGWTVVSADGTDTLTNVEMIDDGVSHTLLVGKGGFATIQAAVNAAQNGDTILIANGEYTEQVDLVGKGDIVLMGESEGGVIVKAPASLTANETDPWSGRSLFAVIEISNSTNVTIKNLTVDGDSHANGIVPGGDFNGIAYVNSSGLIDSVTVKEIRDPLVDADSVSGIQRGNAILSTNAAGSPNSLEIANTTIQEFQKTGIVARNTDIYLHDSTIHGFGPQDVIAQNGVQLSSGSTGEVSNNTIDNLGFLPGTTSVAGLLVISPGDGLIVTGNTFGGTGASDIGVYLDNANGAVVSDNSFDGHDTGVVVEGHMTVPADVVNEGAGANTYANITGTGYELAPDTSDTVSYSADGTQFHDDLAGGAGADTFHGVGGNDTIDGQGGIDTATYGDALSVASFSFTGGQWHVATGTEGSDTLANVEVVTDGAGHTFRLVGTAGDDGYASVQAAIDASNPGDIILIAPGTYTETHTTIHGTAGIYINTANLTLQGYSSVDGQAVTTGAGAKAGGPTIISGAQNGFGANHWIDVGGDNTILNGLHLQAGASTNNKLVEVWGDNATVSNSFVDTNIGGTTYSNAIGIYFNDDGNPASDEIHSYTVTGNILNEGVYAANGVGDATGAVDPDQKITNNTFEGHFDNTTGVGRYDTVGSGGNVPGTAWLNETVQPPTFTGNTFGDNSTPFILRGSDANPAYLPSASLIASYLANNGDANTTYAYGLTGGALATALRNDGAGDYHSYAVTNTLDTLELALDHTADAVFGSTPREYIASGDTVVIQSGASGTVNSQVMVDGLTIQATANSADLNLTLADTFADGTDIPVDVHSITLADYAPGLGANVDVTGNGLANTIIGNSGANALNGGAGNDDLTGRGGADTLDGGANIDTAHYNGPVTLTANGSNWTVDSSANGEGVDTVVNVEKIDNGTGTTLLVGSGGFASIQAAIDASTSGDTILIAAGTYNENVNVNKAGLTLVGQGEVTIHGTFESDNHVTGDMHLWIEGQSAYSGAAGDGVQISADNVTLTNLNIDGFTYGVHFRVDTTNTTLNQVDITNSVIGIEKATTANINGLAVNGGTITDGYIGIDFAKVTGVGNAADGVATGVMIDGMSFSGISQKGIYAETLTDSTLSNITMNDVGQFGGGTAFGAYGKNGNGINLNLKAGTYDNIVIEDFHLTDTGASDRRGADAVGEAHGGAIVVSARDDGGTYGPQPAVVTDAIIIRNGVIDGHTSGGIQVGETTKTNADPDVTVSNVTISGAQHTGNHGEIGNETLSTLTFTGTASGESIFTSQASTGAIVFHGGGGNDTFTGHAEHDTADFSAELTVASFTATGSAWTVNGGAEGVDTLVGVEKVTDATGGDFLLVGSGGYATIQAAVNAAQAGDTILVAAGTYTETVTVTKGVTIVGAKHGIDGAASGRGVGDGAGETNLIGRLIIDTTQAISVDGLRFVDNAAAGVNDYANPSVEVKKGGDTTGHQILNSVFYSTVAGGAENDIAIFVRGAATGSTTIEGNNITGSALGQYGTAAWGRGVYSDGGGQTLTIDHNTFQSVRSGINLDSYNDAVTTVSNNNFALVGTAISVGIPTGGTYAGIHDNLFQVADLDVNLQNVTLANTLDLSGTSNTSTPGQTTYVTGGTQGDTLTGTAGVDYLQGNGGNDTLKGGGNDDTLNGGAGTDTAVYASLTPDMLSFNGTNWIVTTGGAEGTDTLIDMEFVTDGTHTYSLAGGSAVTFTSTPAAASVTEDTDAVSGQLTNDSSAGFADLDPSDTHTVSGTIVLDGSTAHADGVAAGLVEGVDYSLVATVNEAGHTVGYHWNVSNAAVNALAAGESITFTAHETISDGATNASQDVVLTVNGHNDLPTTSNVTLTNGTEDVGIVITQAQLLANASDVDGNSLTVSGVSSNHGAVVNNGDGTWTYTPTANYSGAVSFSYSINDGVGSTAGTASLSLAPVSDTPNLSASNASGNENGSIPLTISSSLVDTDGSETLSIVISGVPTGATLNHGVDNGGGNWTLTSAQLAGLSLTPASGYNGDFNLGVVATATDGAATPATASQSILVHVQPGTGGIVGNTDSLLVTRNLASSLDLAVLTGNDTGGVGALTVTGITNVTGGTASIVGGRLAVSATAGSGGFDYTLTDANNHVQTGHANFSSVVTDGTNNTVLSGAVTGADLQGQDGNDALTGSSGMDRLVGGNGNDVLNGGAGADLMLGGVGDDIYTVDNVNDVVTELSGEGTADQVNSTVSFTLGANVEKLVLGGSGDINGTGNGLDNYILGNGGPNTLIGGAGKDVISGGAGNDFITGGLDGDQLTGGLGADTFVYTTLGDFGSGGTNDRISDFNRADGDKLDLTGVDANSNLANDQAFTFLGAGAFTHLAGELRATATASGNIVQGDVNGDGVADFTFVVVGPASLVSGDFFF